MWANLRVDVRACAEPSLDDRALALEQRKIDIT